jgi:hypothetical protein
VRGRPIQVIRHLVVLFTGFLAGSRAVDAGFAWREWQGSGGSHDAAANREYFLVDLAVAVLSLAIAALVWWLLRPKPPPG